MSNSNPDKRDRHSQGDIVGIDIQGLRRVAELALKMPWEDSVPASATAAFKEAITPDAFLDLLENKEKAEAEAEAERDALAARLAELEGQEPVGETQHLHELNDEWAGKLPIGTKLFARPIPAEPSSITDGFVQPVPDHCDRIVWRGSYYHLPITKSAEPVNARLLEALKSTLQWIDDWCQTGPDMMFEGIEANADAAIASAEAQGVTELNRIIAPEKPLLWTSGEPREWKPTPESINNLPDPIRRYIHDLETNADPAGMVQENFNLRESLKGLERMYIKVTDPSINIGMMKVLKDVQLCGHHLDDEAMSKVNKVISEAQVAPEPKRLTDEERQKLWNISIVTSPGWERHLHYARAIEAAVLGVQAPKSGD